MKKSGGPGSRYSQRKNHRSRRSPQKKHIKNIPIQKPQNSFALNFKMPAFLKHYQARNLVRLFFREDRRAVRWYLLVILGMGIIGPGIVLIRIGTQNFYLRGLSILTLVVVTAKVLPVPSEIYSHSERLIGGWKFHDLHFSERIHQFFPMGKKPSQKPADKAADAAKISQLLHLGTYETEIDALYQCVKKQRAIHIEEITQRFKVPRELVQEWAKILEEHKLITIYYPSFGSPVLKLYDEPLESQQGGNT